MSNPIFINQVINNGALSAIKAMPLKDKTSDNTSSFELSRKIYENTYTTALTNDQVLSAIKPSYYGMNGVRPTVFDGTTAPIQKKWMGSTNRDASQITANRRTNSVGKGSLNYNTTKTVQTPVYSYEAILVGSLLSNTWSSDGITWNQTSMNMIALDNIWTGSSWISTGIDTGNGVIATSIDGINWTQNEESGGFFDLGVAIATNNNNIVVMGESTQTEGSLETTNTLIYSTDSGSSWNAVQNSSEIFTNLKTFAPIKVKSGLIWNGNVWVGTGSGPNSFGYSSEEDGSIWQAGISTLSNLPDTSYNIFQVGTSLANNDNFCVGVGFSISGEIFNNENNNNNQILPSRLIAWSDDGINWTPATLRDINNNIINTLTDSDYAHYIATDVAFNGTKWIATCVDTSNINNQTDSYTFVSSDGKNWTINPLSTNLFPLSIVWMGTQWIISSFITNQEGGATLLYSTDGLNWETNTEWTSLPFFNMIWNGGTVNNVVSTTYTSSTTDYTPTLSFTNGNDRNLLNRTLRRVRGGGYVAPPKKAASPSQTYVPSHGTHPYMQPGFKGKIGGYFPNSRYNISNM